MLRRLRTKVTIAITGVSALVCSAAFIAIMATTCANVYEPLHNSLVMAAELGPGAPFSPIIGRQDPPFAPSGPQANDVTPTAVALVARDGAVLETNATYQLMNPATGAAAIEAALEGQRDEGFIGSLEVFYYRVERGGVTTVALVDASGFVQSMEKTGAGVALVFLGVIGAVGVLASLLSRRIVRPVQEAWDRQTEFVADASHELKTPLTVILANAKILEGAREGLGHEERTWVEGIGEEAHRMKRLVEELLFLARNDEAGQGAGQARETVDLAELVRQACLSFDAVAFEAGVKLRERVEENISLHGERAQLERLVRSLIENAIKYAGRGGTVTVTLAQRKKGRPTLAVHNTGEPIAPQDLERVFDRFWRCDQARCRADGAGFGLGLAIAKSIAEAHGGNIDATSSPEDGTTFTVAF